MFLRKYKYKRLLCEHNILTEVVSVTHLSRNREDSFWQSVSYDKLPFQKQQEL